MGKAEITTIPYTRKCFYDTYANLPIAGVKQGDLGFATDRLVLYRWSGAAWAYLTFHFSSGAAAAIPAAATLPNGSCYFTTDTDILRQVQAGAWVTIMTPPDAPTKEFFIPVTGGDNVAAGFFKGNYPTVSRLDANMDKAFVAIHIPHNFTTLVNAVFLIIADDTNAVSDLDIHSDYGSVGEAFNIHSENDVASTYPITNTILYEIDISGILSAIVAGDYVGICLEQKELEADLYAIGVRIRYT